MMEDRHDTAAAKAPTPSTASRLVFPKMYGLKINTNIDELDKEQHEHQEPIALTSMPERALAARKYYRAAYLVIIAALCAAVLTTPRIFLRDANGDLQGDDLAMLILLVLLALGSFMAVQGSNPGFIGLDHMRGSHIGADGERANTLAPNEFVTSVTELHSVALSAREASPDQILLGSPSRSVNDDDDDDTDSEASEGFVLDVEPDEALDESLGHVQRSRVPMRAKFCRNSQRYVATYDHYCGVLGTCIGEKNHCRFWWFLLTHTLGLAYMTRVVQSGFQDTKAEVGTWLDHNTHALLVFLVVVILLCAVGSLLLFHTFLACAAMTSYEFLRADKISYLEGTRDFDLPFSRGLRTNLHRFCILDGIKLFCVAHEEWRPRQWARAL
ncbi:Protein S-acyltransferase 10 [Hondaea fermentalgiana]|uniref:Palmitoyltransferase n=1 Tax=Hondaea fermentalgiana TaxID=2315210 RepID=A0A2R5GTB8_9STRA|nr:Protein S-acyltransferase 10 [Hondaea fermentalgiana]|eukprot:GBG34080.1 Protein S-acyltransferase 10 [Hondaea fermentalgiana]